MSKTAVYINGIKDQFQALQNVVVLSTTRKLMATELRQIKHTGGFTLFGLDLDEAIKLMEGLAARFNYQVAIFPDDTEPEIPEQKAPCYYDPFSEGWESY